MSLRVWFFILTFIFAITAGIYFGKDSWGGKVAWQDGQFRNPSAVHPLRAAPTLNANKLHQDWKKSLITEALPENDGKSMGLKLGNFVITDDSGKKRLACELFETIRVRFEGAHQMSGPAPSQLVMELPCAYENTSEGQKSGDLNFIRTVWIPMKDLLESPAEDTIQKDEDNISMEFINITEWPLAWNLVSVRFEGGAALPLEIDRREILKQRSGTPLILTWID